MSSGDDIGKKKSGGTRSVLRADEMEMRSWQQWRACELYREDNPVAALVDNDKWAPGYRQAREEWENRWPYGQPDFHEECCQLHDFDGVGECDCKASDASDTEWGICH